MFTQRLRKFYADGVLPTRARKPCVNQISQGLRKVYAQGNLLMALCDRSNSQPVPGPDGESQTTALLLRAYVGF